MPVTIVGKQPSVERCTTGLWSFDHALKGGYPLRTMTELYGSEHVGKSTLAYYLSAMAGHQGVALCDLEGFDPSYLTSCYTQARYDGTVYVVPHNDPKSKLRTHEDMLSEMLTRIDKRQSSAAIFDSVGAFVPLAEAQGELGDANMGQAAKRIAQLSRRATRILNSQSEPSTLIVVNHTHPIIGMGKGHTTPGGIALRTLAQVRIWIWPRETIKVKEDNAAYVIMGAIEKLRYGGKGGKFMVVNLAGYGIDKNLTAMIDCVNLGLAERGASVKVGRISVGRMSTLIEAARERKDEIFEPFFEALRDHGVDTAIEVEGDDGEAEDTDEPRLESEEQLAD